MPIDRLVQTLQRHPNRKTDYLHHLLSECHLDQDFVERHMPATIPHGSYHRNLLHHGEDYELVIATWPVGGRTLIHDHGIEKSHGVVRILLGTVFNHPYRLVGEDCVDLVNRTSHKAGEYIAVPRGLIHAMGNDGNEVAMSLHLYSPMIVSVTYWDPATLKPYQKSA